METIRVKWGVNVSEGYEQIELEELECENLKEWESLSIEEQRERLQKAIDERPDQVCSIVEW